MSLHSNTRVTKSLLVISSAAHLRLKAFVVVSTFLFFGNCLYMSSIRPNAAAYLLSSLILLNNFVSAIDATSWLLDKLVTCASGTITALPSSDKTGPVPSFVVTTISAPVALSTSFAVLVALSVASVVAVISPTGSDIFCSAISSASLVVILIFLYSSLVSRKNASIARAVSLRYCARCSSISSGISSVILYDSFNTLNI